MIIILHIEKHPIDMSQEDKIQFTTIHKKSIQTHFIQKETFHQRELKDILQIITILTINTQIYKIINTDTDVE
jgi:hypothetical protein